MTEYVYIQCYDSVWRINLTELSSNSTWSYPYVSAADDEVSVYYNDIIPRREKYPTPFEHVFDFTEDMPIGMVPIVVNEDIDHQKLYFVAGVKLLQGFNWYDYYFRPRGGRNTVDYSYGCNGFNLSAFPIDSCTPSSITSMKSPKFNPIVATYENKSYVFSRARRFNPLNKTLHTFEVYDHALGIWEPLPDPPPVQVGSIYFIFNRTFYIRAVHDHVFIYYDINTRVWKIDNNPPYLYDTILSFLGRDTGHVAEYDGCVVSYGCGNKLVSYCFDDKNGPNSSCHKPLRVLDELKDLVEDPLLNDGRGHVFHLGNGRMCFVIYGYHHSKNSMRFLRVATFQFNPCGQSDVITNHIFNAHKLPFDIGDLKNVFPMVEQSRKRVLDSLVGGRNAKRPKIITENT